MDKRTIQIRELRNKLGIARDFIRSVHSCTVTAFDENKVMNKSYWANKSFDIYETTK